MNILCYSYSNIFWPSGKFLVIKGGVIIGNKQETEENENKKPKVNIIWQYILCASLLCIIVGTTLSATGRGSPPADIISGVGAAGILAVVGYNSGRISRINKQLDSMDKGFSGMGKGIHEHISSIRQDIGGVKEDFNRFKEDIHSWITKLTEEVDKISKKR